MTPRHLIERLITEVEVELAAVSRERAALDERERLLMTERDGLRLATRRLPDAGGDTIASLCEEGEATDPHETPRATGPTPPLEQRRPSLAEDSRAKAIIRVLELHGGCELDELVTLLRAHGRFEETKDPVSVRLTWLKNRGVVENQAGEWRLSEGTSRLLEVRDGGVTPNPTGDAAQAD